MRERKRNVRHLPRGIVPQVSITEVLGDTTEDRRGDGGNGPVDVFPYEKFLQPQEDEGAFGGTAASALEEVGLAVADPANDGEGAGGVVFVPFTFCAGDVKEVFHRPTESIGFVSVFLHVRIIVRVVMGPVLPWLEFYQWCYRV
mmetsp:Transcript_11530/g.24581  ORF Transcript_11530/g.24581 Transcript_11530/m.24581 type:complete len:144 (+) Transcript_11530:435-866(+)